MLPPQLDRSPAELPPTASEAILLILFPDTGDGALSICNVSSKRRKIDVDACHAQIVHRRLGVRNVLLKKQTSGLVAKLIGFGPSAEDINSGNKESDVSRPLRWLAPETLNTMKLLTPTYNNKTDAWSFGITVWEMYSKGRSSLTLHA